MGGTQRSWGLLEKGADVDLVDNMHHQSALCWASEMGHATVVELLLKKGASPSCRDISGSTLGCCSTQRT